MSHWPSDFEDLTEIFPEIPALAGDAAFYPGDDGTDNVVLNTWDGCGGSVVLEFPRSAARALAQQIDAIIHPESVAAERVRSGDHAKVVRELADHPAQATYADPSALANPSPNWRAEFLEALESIVDVPEHLRRSVAIDPFSEFTDDYGNTLIQLHREFDDCEKYGCPVHSPSFNSTLIGKLRWRDDRGIFERVCEHGVGHPDPDMLNWMTRTFGGEYAQGEGIHGCDGCCRPPSAPSWNGTGHGSDGEGQ